MQAQPVEVHDIRGSHGAHTTSRVLELFDRGLPQGAQVLCHHHYRIRIVAQTRSEIFREALAIESYVCLEMPQQQ